MGFTIYLPLLQGKNKLLVCVDKFSKFCHLIPIFLG